MNQHINGDIGVLIWSDGQVSICEENNRDVIQMNRDTAINIARAILRHFEEEKK